MSYTSLLYLIIFLPIVMTIYQCVSNHNRWKVLLSASYIFFFIISKKLIVYIILSTLSMHYIGIWLCLCKKKYIQEREEAEDKRLLKELYTKKRRKILWLGIGIQLSVLIFLKYYGFIFKNLNGVFNMISFPVVFHPRKLILPIGISFYTLQAISYMVDVYQEKIECDENIGRLALFMAFFPNIMEGPICRYSDTAQQLYSAQPLKYENVTFGIQRILWGMFKNIVISDRLNPIVTHIFNNYKQYGGLIIVVGAACYTFQLYMNFSGCVDITIGTAQIFGITMPENFRQPFFAKTPSEFWHRWHITLGTWFKDYIFYPLSLTNFVKKLGRNIRKSFGNRMSQIISSSIALFAVWICNGLWHGPRWSYIFYGIYYFVLIVLGNIFGPMISKGLTKLRIDPKGIFWRTVQTIKMLIIIFTGEMFFRAKGLKAGILMFKSIFHRSSWQHVQIGIFPKMGLSLQDFIIVTVGLIIILIVGISHEKGVSIRKKIGNLNIFMRWGAYYAAILAIIIFGAYGFGYLQAEMMYAGF